MVKNSFILSIMMICLGLGGYLASSTGSATALIPLAIGSVILISSYVGTVKEEKRKVMVNLSALASLVGVVAAAIGMPETYELWQKGGSPLAFVAQLMTAGMCVTLLLAYIRSLSELGKEQLA